VSAFEERLEIFVFIGIFQSSIWFLFLVNMSKSKSFVLSEYDIAHVKVHSNIYEVDIMELRFNEMNNFNGHCAPLFINAAIMILTRIDNDKLYQDQYLVLYISALQAISYSLFFFFDLREAKSCISIRRALFAFLLFVNVVGIPILLGLFMIFYCGPIGFFASAYDPWNYTYCCMMFYPALSFILNFRNGEPGGVLTGVFNIPRWYAIFGKPIAEQEGARSQVSAESDNSGMESLLYSNDSSVVQSGPIPYHESKEFKLPVKDKLPTKVRLDHSLLSLYFISQLNLDGERTLPSNLLDVNRTEGSTNQLIFNGRYLQYVLFSSFSQAYLTQVVISYLKQSVICQPIEV
jgi:hypothetical protein